MNGAETFGIDISQDKADQFVIHAGELIRWNKKINITAITNPLEVAVKHYLDSIAPANIILPGASMLDIGSGGGFPGIVLKILIPSLSVTLIDASRKRVNFLKHVIRTLKLKNIEARHIRSDELAGDPAIANSFDVIICRALCSLDAFVLMALPLLAKNGILIALKGLLTLEEIESASLLIAKYYAILPDTLRGGPASAPALYLENYTLPYLGLKRSIVVSGTHKK